MGYSYNWFTALTNIEGILTGVGHIKYSYGITCIGQQLLVAIQHVGYRTEAWHFILKAETPDQPG